jgi:hypothetical protein
MMSNQLCNIQINVPHVPQGLFFKYIFLAIFLNLIKMNTLTYYAPSSFDLKLSNKLYNKNTNNPHVPQGLFFKYVISAIFHK